MNGKKIVGSIEVGKKADLILIDLESSMTEPINDVFSNIVYNATPDNVITTIIDGNIVMENGIIRGIEEKEIYISTQTACSTGNYSSSVFAVTKDKEKASRSMRISISYQTTKEEIDIFIKSLDESIKKLDFRR